MKIALLLAPLALLAGCTSLPGTGPICNTAITITSTVEQIAAEFEARGILPEQARVLAEKARQAANIAAAVCEILARFQAERDSGAAPADAGNTVIAST